MKNKFISKVYQWLCIGLLVTFGLGYAITLDEGIMVALLSNYFLVVIAEVVAAIALSLFLHKMSDTTAKILYLLYAALSGVTFSTIFVVFEMESILYVFIATAVIFGLFSLIGKKIKANLSGFGTFLFIALLGMIILSFLNTFMLDKALDLTTCLVSLLIFVGYIVYDTNRIINISETNLDEKYAIFGAFQLYLDIINIIIDLLGLTGDRKN